MPLFHYKGRRSGELIEGKMEAESEHILAGQLTGQGIVPIEIKPIKEVKNVEQTFQELFSFGSVGLYPLVTFCRQMYTLSKSGVPIVYAISLLRDNLKHPVLRRTLKDIVDHLKAGRSLADCFARHPKVFSQLFISLIRVGENTGRLDLAFQQLGVYLEREHTTRKNIVSALRYPAFVIATILVAVMIVSIWVIPVFAELFKGLKAELPWATRVLIVSSDFLVKYWMVVVGGMIGGVWLFMRYIKTPSGQYVWDAFKLKIPKVGPVVEHAVLGKFANAFGLMLRTGVPMIQALTIIAAAVDNTYIGRKILAMRSAIEKGENLSKTATTAGIFSPLILQMMRVGEETGTVDELLQEVAAHYDREVEYSLKSLTNAIEPTIIVFIAVLVLILAMGVFLPLWDLSTAVNR